MTVNEIVPLASVVLNIGINIALYAHLRSVMNSRFGAVERRLASLESRMASFESTMTARFDLLLARMGELKKEIHDK